jgi:O-acetyl-ADP-ribose deacetylase (regulator of RNase III)
MATTLLASCYRRSREVAHELGARTIAFPAIGTGVYGYPVEGAARAAVRTVRETLATLPGFDEVIFCCFSESDLRHRERILSEPGTV